MHFPVGHEPLQSADGNGFVHLAAVAGRLARVRADPADGERKGQALADLGQRFGILAVGHQTHVGPNVQVGWTGSLTNRHVFFENIVLARRGIEEVDGRPEAEPFVEIVIEVDGAHLDTGFAVVALFPIHAGRPLPDGKPVASVFRLRFLNLRVGDDPHIGMLPKRRHVRVRQPGPIDHQASLGDASPPQTRRRFHQDHLPTCLRLR